MKMSELVRLLFLPRDYDQHEHESRDRALRQASADRRSAFRQVRQRLKEIDIGRKVEDLGRALDHHDER